MFNVVLINVYKINSISRNDHFKVSSSHYSRLAHTTSVLNDKDFSTLFDIIGFKFLLNHPQKCNTEKLFMIIFVHSAIQNFEKRDTIRKSWGNVKIWKENIQIELIFLVGLSNNTNVTLQVEKENNLYNDIVQGNFFDSYRNITYKHVMGLKWVSYFCNNAKFVFKTDDDIFVDLFQLIYYLKGTIGESPQNLMACYLNKRSTVFRSYRNKWRVSHKVN